jgi:hypothetical protein
MDQYTTIINANFTKRKEQHTEEWSAASWKKQKPGMLMPEAN